MSKKNENNKSSQPTTVAFDYIKSATFRSIRADGAIGAVTPNGHIHMAFYSERSAIPRRMIHELKKDGTLGEPHEIETRNSVVREMDVDVFMTLEAAISLRDWLAQRIEECQNIKKL